jgi:hypothetical protein
VLGWEAVSEAWIEPAFVLLAVGLALLALVRGYARHRQWRVALLFVAGLASMAAGHWLAVRWAEPWLVVAGGLLLALAHWRNRTACATCALCAAAPPAACACGDH